MRIFGFSAWMHIPKELRTKIEAKAKECVMVGYEPNGYRLWDPDAETIRSARDVIFNEKKMYFSKENKVLKDLIILDKRYIEKDKDNNETRALNIDN